MKYDLTNTTFIIPIFIESADREKNARITLSYLDKYLNTNIILYEFDVQSKVEKILSEISPTNKINHIFFENKDNKLFHRTKFLNEMLAMVKTPVVVNYDIDVLLTPRAYLQSQYRVLLGKDLVYPYDFGNSQIEVSYKGRDFLENTLDLEKIPEECTEKEVRSEFGHCQFFNTESYIEGGMENEFFISYGPEDKERGWRFQNLGYKVEWLKNNIYHIKHSRGINSSKENPLIDHNNQLINVIESMKKNQLEEYYKKVNYLEKYKDR
jgi:hypothetical protein